MIAEYLLQKTNADKVLPIYNLFITKYQTINDVTRADIVDIENIIMKLGLIKRAKFIKETSLIILNDHNGYIPDSFEDLHNLPGIGSYSANAMLCFAFNRKAPLIDVNVARIFSRFFDLSSEKRIESNKNLWTVVEQVLDACPVNMVKQYQYGLLDFAALICKARNPYCVECPLSKNCSHFAG